VWSGGHAKPRLFEPSTLFPEGGSEDDSLFAADPSRLAQHTVRIPILALLHLPDGRQRTPEIKLQLEKVLEFALYVADFGLQTLNFPRTSRNKPVFLLPNGDISCIMWVIVGRSGAFLERMPIKHARSGAQ
jgi:hypothetical protein